MLAWLSENIATILVLLVLVCIVTAILVRQIKNKKGGKSSCGCGCQSCPMSDSCHSKQ